MAVNATLPALPELCHIPGTALPVKRLKALDVLLLLVLLPAWGAALVLHVRQIYRGRLAWVGVFVAAPATRTEHPTVRGFWPGTDGAASGLLVGDRLVRAGRRCRPTPGPSRSCSPRWSRFPSGCAPCSSFPSRQCRPAGPCRGGRGSSRSSDCSPSAGSSGLPCRLPWDSRGRSA